ADYKFQEIFATNVQYNAALLAHGMNLDVISLSARLGVKFQIFGLRQAADKSQDPLQRRMDIRRDIEVHAVGQQRGIVL
ncbi:hypothetical protein ACC687_41840, partial [Rhizobium ruizarguesonis]